MNYKQIKNSEIIKYIDPIDQMRKEWNLITAEVEGKANTLTAAWGAFGNVCNKQTATIYIRPQRYTKAFLDQTEYFTISFFDGQMEALQYLGSHSGRDYPDKIKESGLTLTHIEDVPTFEEARLVLKCKPFFVQQLSPENFLDKELRDKTFAKQDYSYMYIAEIVGAYIAK